MLMKTIDLSGKWRLNRDGAEPIPGRLPGCTYLDLMANGMPDPYYGENEIEAGEWARHDYRYTRTFLLDEETLKAKHLELVADGLDTLCSISINGKAAGKTDNINRVWRLDVKGLCVSGENSITLDFSDPYGYIEAKQKSDPLPKPMNPVDGVGHLRKTPCHFGWDWGPKLPPAGVARSIGLEAFDIRVTDLRIWQEHREGAVTIRVAAKLSDAKASGVEGKLAIIEPNGKKAVLHTAAEGASLRWDICVENPRLWWCNGLGEQPLYRLDLSIAQNGKEADRFRRQIGLRTVELDTAPDSHGHQFRFVVNGVPVFAKGANWIPPDSFITRADRETVDFYVETAKRANMNMLRVWGGGMYESEDFYDACDRNGILVWQDFIFACNPYPFYEKSFLDNVHAEVEDNVRRLRHRASLALWCGNNETEVFVKAWGKWPKVLQSNPDFYHNVLRGWVAELDGVTAYWPGSPSSGSASERPYNMKEGQIRGDTHLWQIWHGMRPIEAFRKFPTRFCSEYGMESMPSMHTIRTFTDDPDPGLFDPVMQSHQKCPGGNEKILYYLLAKYRNPARLEDYVYLSQLVQADTVHFATDCWRRNIGRQNGAVFWQMNDCWPVASWAGIDYGKQLKAVLYQSRHFNKTLCLSGDCFRDRVEISVVNEYPREFHGRLEWTLKDFFGHPVSDGEIEIAVGPVASEKAAVLRFADILKGRKKTDAVLEGRLLDESGVKDIKRWLLVPDKAANLPQAQVEYNCREDGGAVTLELSSTGYARHVFLEMEGVTAPWSDNFFDIPAGESVTVTARLPDGMDKRAFESGLKIKTLADVKPRNNLDILLRAFMMMRKKNFIYWFLFRILFR
jgi:beta-mannosidase